MFEKKGLTKPPVEISHILDIKKLPMLALIEKMTQITVKKHIKGNVGHFSVATCRPRMYELR